MKDFGFSIRPRTSVCSVAHSPRAMHCDVRRSAIVLLPVTFRFAWQFGHKYKDCLQTCNGHLNKCFSILDVADPPPTPKKNMMRDTWLVVGVSAP